MRAISHYPRPHLPSERSSAWISLTGVQVMVRVTLLRFHVLGDKITASKNKREPNALWFEVQDC